MKTNTKTTLKNQLAELNEVTVMEQFAKGKKHLLSRGNNCVIYTRVSGKEQEDGYSLDTQLQECKEYAQKNNYNILGHFGACNISDTTTITG